jgi:RimJ/RimL family protein N-acetyltransferase
MELAAEGLLLRTWRLEDAPAVTLACQDPDIPRWIPFVPFPYTNEDAVTYLTGCIEAGESRVPLAIVDMDTRQLLGSIDMSVNAMRTGHIGYWVARQARGRGVATVALRRICRFAFDELGVQRLELVTDPDNRASQRVAEKAGFQREGVLRSHLLHRDGRRRDSVMFSLLPSDLD